MKISIATPDENTFSVMQRIIDGTLTISSPEEFREILEIYPEDPFLYRKYADLLRKENRYADAAKAYDRTARFFLANGMHLQAIVAKIMQWRIDKPDHEQGRAFHALMQPENDQPSGLQSIWARMRYPELVAVMRRLVRVQFRAGNRIIRAGQRVDQVYFIVAGTAAEMPSPDCETEAKMSGIDVEPVLLGPNDVFGEILPLDQSIFAETEIRAVSDLEAIKINKSVLNDICQKYPQIKNLLSGIHRSENRDNCERAWQTVRRAMRFGLPSRVEISCPSTRNDPESWHHAGNAVDLSIGGICIDLGETSLPGAHRRLKGRLVQLNLDLSHEALIHLSGKIVWQRLQESARGSATLIGIRFDTLKAADRDRIAAYCKSGMTQINRSC